MGITVQIEQLLEVLISPDYSIDKVSYPYDI
jgi:hypothetical protein